MSSHLDVVHNNVFSLCNIYTGNCKRHAFLEYHYIGVYDVDMFFLQMHGTSGEPTINTPIGYVTLCQPPLRHAKPSGLSEQAVRDSL